jgi:ubiquitin carboxyl-terminal hydrolase 16/45
MFFINPVISPVISQTEPEVINPGEEEVAESAPSGFVVAVDPADRWPCYESKSSDAQGYAIKGIPNLGNTCYLSAVLQCLFVLGKLRERMLTLDGPKSLITEVLEELFLEASAAGGVLNPIKLLNCLNLRDPSGFQIGTMEDSHDLLTALRAIWNESDKNNNKQSDAPTMMDSIFRFEMARTLSCKKCGHSSAAVRYPFEDLLLGFPSKGHPTKSAALPQTSESPGWAGSRKRVIARQLFPEDVQGSVDSEVSDAETLEVGEFMIDHALIKMP